jgi:hypothetical protein
MAKASWIASFAARAGMETFVILLVVCAGYCVDEKKKYSSARRKQWPHFVV